METLWGVGSWSRNGKEHGNNYTIRNHIGAARRLILSPVAGVAGLSKGECRGRRRTDEGFLIAQSPPENQPSTINEEFPGGMMSCAW